MNAYTLLLFAALLFSGLFFAAGEIEGAFYAVCGVVLTVLPIVVLLVSILAAMIYAVGQILGAETRARAAVWATTLFTGALIAAIIFLVIPFVLESLGIGVMADLKAQCLSAVGVSTCPPGQICNLPTCGGRLCYAGQVCINDQCVYRIIDGCAGGCPPGYVCTDDRCIRIIQN